MKNRKLKKEQIAKLQSSCNEYKQKTGFGYKILMGFITGVATISLIGCTDKKTNNNTNNSNSYEYKEVYTGGMIHSIENKYANDELKLESELCEFLCEKTGLDVNLINIKDVKLIVGDNNYLVLTGEMISDVRYGLKDCSIALKISYEQAKLAEEFLTFTEKFMSDDVGYAGGLTVFSLNEDIASLKYDDGFLKGMKGVIDDDKTQVVSIYNSENEDLLYDNEQLGMSK